MMSVEATRAVWNMRNLNGAQKLVAVRLADRANGDNQAWPSTASLAVDTCLSERTVQGALKGLVVKGVVTCEPHKGTRGTNRYTVVLDAQPPADSAPRKSCAPAESVPTPADSAPPTPAVPAPELSPTTVSRTVTNPPTPRSTELVPVNGSTPAKGSPVEQVFAAWQEASGHHKALLDAKRRRVITAALKAYSLGDVTDAVRGWRHSPWHRGENPTRTVYDDLSLLLRDSSNIEKFRDLEQDGPPAVARNVSKGARNLAAVAARMEGS